MGFANFFAVAKKFGNGREPVDKSVRRIEESEIVLFDLTASPSVTLRFSLGTFF